MVKDDLIKEIILTNESYIEGIEKIVTRENISIPKEINKVVVFYGVRRSGKTYTLFDIWRQNRSNALYIDFEDERLKDFNAEDFQKLKDLFLSLKPHLIGKELVFLLDEIQNVESWERFVRRSVERERIKVFITGSSSKMTPKELHTSLRGRAWGIELLPFSFREYLSTKEVSLSSKKVLYGDNRYKIKKHFTDYLKWGGFPEVCLLHSETEKKKVLREYLEAIFFKDIVERFKVSNINLLEALREKLFESHSLKFSLRAFYKQYKDNFPFSKDYLSAYYKHFLESLIVFEVLKFSPSSYKRLRNPAKVYLVDPGIARGTASEDFGRKLENVIFLELKRRGFGTFYFEEYCECDFIAKDETGKFLPIQVTLELSKSNREREIKGLTKACDHLGISEGMILTLNEEGEEKIERKKISIIPAWKWLIEGK